MNNFDIAYDCVATAYTILKAVYESDFHPDENSVGYANSAILEYLERAMNAMK